MLTTSQRKSVKWAPSALPRPAREVTVTGGAGPPLGVSMGIRRLVPWLVLALFPALAGAQGVVHGKAAHATAPLPQRTAMHAQAYPVASERVVMLAALQADAKALVSSDDKRMRVGIARDVTGEAQALTPSTLEWVATADGGRALHLRVTSSGALALRVGLAIRGLAPGAELRVSGGDGVATAAPVDAATIAESLRLQGVYWTAVTEGQTQLVELWLPAGARVTPSVSITSVSHLLAAPSRLLKSTGPGTAQACEENVACVAGNNPALARAADAVAKLLYTENGVSYLCTGTLVSDGDAASQVPYMLTASHCIDSDAAAATLNTFWFFQSASCSGKDAAGYKQLSGGASLLFSDSSSDVALVRLRDLAPDGAWFAGWDATPLTPGTATVTLHHPSGDVKKVSLGQSLDAIGTAPASYTMVAWTTGSTEGGSSGSGLFTFDGRDFVLRGALRGGSASCQTSGDASNPANRDFYSRLDLAGPTLAKWLATAPAPLDDYSGLWWDPAEPGWGLSITQSQDNHVFVAWFTYDAQAHPTWMVMPQASWKTAVALEGALYRTQGSAFDAPYDASAFSVEPAGTLHLEFASGGGATATFTVDGQTVVKALRRQPI